MHVDPDQSDWARFAWNMEAIGDLPVLGTVFIDADFLREMGLYEQIELAFERVGWPSFMTLSSPADAEDTREFLASMTATRPPQRAMRYRHRGVYYICEWDELAEFFGFVVPEPEDMDHHSAQEAWEEMASTPTYRSGRSLGKDLREPWMFYLQRLVSHSIVGRYNGSQRPAVRDMEVLRGFYYGTQVDFASVLVQYWANISIEGAILVGGLVTYFLRRAHAAPEDPSHEIVPPAFLTRQLMRMYTGITIRRDGVAYWSFRSDLPAPPPEDAQQGRRRQPRRAAAARGAEPAHSEAPAPAVRSRRAAPAQSAPARSAPQSAPAATAYDFYVARVTTYWGDLLGFEMMPPPPGWRVGDPVPPVFLVPPEDERQAPYMRPCTTEPPPESSRAAEERARAARAARESEVRGRAPEQRARVVAYTDSSSASSSDSEADPAETDSEATESDYVPTP